MVDNFQLIRTLLDFSSDDDFYFLQILKRKKENPEISSNHNNIKRAIKMYYISSLDYYDSIEKEIKELCKLNNARAYIHLCKRSHERTAKETLRITMERVLENQFQYVHRAYNTACGNLKSLTKTPYFILDKEVTKLWLLDFDHKDINLRDRYIGLIPQENYITSIPTKNEYHLITTPFNIKVFSDICLSESLELLDIQKNNPTVLYYEEKTIGESISL